MSRSCLLGLPTPIQAGVISQNAHFPPHAKEKTVLSLIGRSGYTASWGYIGGITGTDCCGASEVVCTQCPSVLSLWELTTAIKNSIFLAHIKEVKIQYTKDTYLSRAIREFNRCFSPYCEITAHKEGENQLILVNAIKDFDGFQKNVAGWVPFL